MNDQEQLALKREFASALLTFRDNPVQAAFSITDNTGLALEISKKWPNDSFVKAEQEKLLVGKDAKSFLPTKEQQALNVYAIATDAQRPTEDRLKAHRLYAEIMGHIEKPTMPATSVNVLGQCVMVVQESPSDKDWQEKAVIQQRKLISAAN